MIASNRNENENVFVFILPLFNFRTNIFMMKIEETIWNKLEAIFFIYIIHQISLANLKDTQLSYTSNGQGSGRKIFWNVSNKVHWAITSLDGNWRPGTVWIKWSVLLRRKSAMLMIYNFAIGGIEIRQLAVK